MFDWSWSFMNFENVLNNFKTLVAALKWLKYKKLQEKHLKDITEETSQAKSFPLKSLAQKCPEYFSIKYSFYHQTKKRHATSDQKSCC